MFSHLLSRMRQPWWGMSRNPKGSWTRLASTTCQSMVVSNMPSSLLSIHIPTGGFKTQGNKENNYKLYVL